MGAGIGHNLLEAGVQRTVYNRTAAKTEPLVAAGASRATSPREAAHNADVIISIVGDDDSSKTVWMAEDGLLAGTPQTGAIAIECTTLSLEWVTKLHQTLLERGLRFVDSPLTGGRKAAEAGTLTLLVGADEATLAAARPVLDAFSQELIHFGPPGSGTMYKLIVNLIVAAQSAALAEGILLAEKSGLDLDKVVQGLSSGAVASRVVKAYAQNMATGHHEPVNFSTRWLNKDATYALKLALAQGQSMPVSAVAVQLYQLAISQGLANKNASAVIEALRQK